MANDKDAEKLPIKKVDNICFHCDKKVVSSVKCKKCEHLFHPACLQQASAAKKAVCKHVPAEESSNLKCDEEIQSNDLTEIRRMYQELSRKYISLEHSYQALREKVDKMEKNIPENQKVQSSLQDSKFSAKQPATSRLSRTRQKSAVSATTASAASSAAEPKLGEHQQNKQKTPSKSAVVDVPASESKQNDTPAPDSPDDVVFIDQSEFFPGVSPKENKQKAQEKPEEVKETDWQVVQRKSKARRPEPTKGVRENVTQLSVAAPRSQAWFFLSGFGPNTSPENILQYLMENGLQNCLCFKMKTKKDKWRSSFKLAAPANKKKEIMSPDLWPSGIIANHFLNLQRRLTVREGVTNPRINPM